jgi:hypothetical protein
VPVKGFVLAALLLACPPSAWAAKKAPLSPEEQCRANPMGRLEGYPQSLGRPIAERSGPAPEWLRKQLAKADGASDYESYTPTPQDLAVLRETLVLIPEGLQRAFQERLVGIFFIKNFMGNGLTNWVSDGKGTVYASMVVNPAGFTRSLSETFTHRERSLFRDGEGVRIDAGEKYRGLLYTLLHEGTHVYDFVYGITPYVEPDCTKFFRTSGKLEDSWDVWDGYSRPKKGMGFKLREKLGFYGLDGKPALRGKDAPELYAQLQGSPFVSLYGAKSWAEDAAELVVFHHLTQVMGRPYAVEWTAGGKTGRYEPMKNEKVKERAAKVYGSLK